MTDYKTMLREIMDYHFLTYKEAMMHKEEYGAKQCENCKAWTIDACEMATSGGINGEASICEHCFEHGTSEMCQEVRQVVEEYHQ